MTEGAFKLRRELTLKAPALKAAIRAEGVVFRPEARAAAARSRESEQAPRREALPEVRRGGKLVEVDRLGVPPRLL